MHNFFLSPSVCAHIYTYLHVHIQECVYVWVCLRIYAYIHLHTDLMASTCICFYRNTNATWSRTMQRLISSNVPIICSCGRTQWLAVTHCNTCATHCNTHATGGCTVAKQRLINSNIQIINSCGRTHRFKTVFFQTSFATKLQCSDLRLYDFKCGGKKWEEWK